MYELYKKLYGKRIEVLCIEDEMVVVNTSFHCWIIKNIKNKLLVMGKLHLTFFFNI